MKLNQGGGFDARADCGQRVRGLAFAALTHCLRLRGAASPLTKQGGGLPRAFTEAAVLTNRNAAALPRYESAGCQ
jgi:hypothetical protein